MSQISTINKICFKIIHVSNFCTKINKIIQFLKFLYLKCKLKLVKLKICLNKINQICIKIIQFSSFCTKIKIKISQISNFCT